MLFPWAVTLRLQQGFDASLLECFEGAGLAAVGAGEVGESSARVWDKSGLSHIHTRTRMQMVAISAAGAHRRM